MLSRVQLCDPMDCSPPGSSVHRDFPGKNTGVGCHAFLQGIFPTQGLNPHLLRWQVDSLPPSYPGNLHGLRVPFKQAKSSSLGLKDQEALRGEHSTQALQSGPVLSTQKGAPATEKFPSPRVN